MQPYKPLHRKAYQKNSAQKIILCALAIIVGVIALFFIARAIMQRIGIPALHADDVREGFESKQSLIAKIDDLQNQINTMQAAQDETTQLTAENESLKAELGRSAAGPGVLARVLTTPDRSFYDTMLIDAGSAEGVQVGQIAYAFDSIALGTVSKVGAQQSTVELFSEPNRETSGTSEGSDVGVTLIGRGVGEYEVRMPRDVHFDIGGSISLQTVQTAVLAKIEKIATDPRDPFQRLLAKAPVNLQALKFVIVR